MPTLDDQKPNTYHPENFDSYYAWLIEAEKGLADVAAGRSSDARASIAAIQARRVASRIRDAIRHESPNF